jgi:predicted metal-dependent hydrolase
MTDSFRLALPSGRTHTYKIIPSKRAKYIRIKLSNKGELSVTLPPRSSLKQAHQFIQSKSGWIERHLKTLPSLDTLVIPEFIDLKLLNERWLIKIEATESNECSLIEGDENTLTFTGEQSQLEEYQHLMLHWLKKKARQKFTQMLETLAEEHGFHYQKISIRAQKTRWGSCSSGKNISLNCKLLFMPEAVVKYVMVHELCHTIEMNHSSRFWSLVEDCDSAYLENRKELKLLGRQLNL